MGCCERISAPFKILGHAARIFKRDMLQNVNPHRFNSFTVVEAWLL
jgi:hypothetical protein